MVVVLIVEKLQVLVIQMQEHLLKNTATKLQAYPPPSTRLPQDPSSRLEIHLYTCNVMQ